MTLPSTGPIALSNVNVELSYTSTQLISLNDVIVRSLFAKPLGTIAMSDGRGKAVGGSQTYATAGTFYFTIPAYLNMNVTVNGSGGGGDGKSYTFIRGYNEAGAQYTTYYGGSGGAGGASSFGAPTPIIGNGGGGGNNVDGTASGGSINTTGGGAAGGAAGGGTGSVKGGEGGKSFISYARESGGPSVGSVIPVVVGVGGAGGSPASGSYTYGGTGVVGNVIIAWS
jgi:hypothetical protein